MSNFSCIPSHERWHILYNRYKSQKKCLDIICEKHYVGTKSACMAKKLNSSVADMSRGSKSITELRHVKAGIFSRTWMYYYRLSHLRHKGDLRWLKNNTQPHFTNHASFLFFFSSFSPNWMHNNFWLKIHQNKMFPFWDEKNDIFWFFFSFFFLVKNREFFLVHLFFDINCSGSCWIHLDGLNKMRYT